MIWLTWRQHRIELLIGLLVVGFISIPLLINGTTTHAIYNDSGLARCIEQGGNCNELKEIFRRNPSIYGDTYIVEIFLHLLPIVVGIFIGAPLMAREREHHTYYLAWAQGITRNRWLAVKLCLVGGTTFLGSLILALITTWWGEPVSIVNDPWSNYLIRGMVPVGFAMLGLMIGVVIGTFVRQTVYAMALTLIITLACMIVMNNVYLYLVPPQSVLSPYNQPNFPLGQSRERTIYSKYVDAMGKDIGDIRTYCGITIGFEDPTYEKLKIRCIKEHNIQWKIVYQPAERFWLIQGIETAILLALAAGLVPLAFWRLRRQIS